MLGSLRIKKGLNGCFIGMKSGNCPTVTRQRLSHWSVGGTAPAYRVCMLILLVAYVLGFG